MTRLATLILFFATLAQAGPVTLESLLKEMVDRDAIARFPDPAFTCKQASSYDRASTTPDDPKTWFANGDVNQYIRTETNAGRKEWVMMDEPGPGAIVRLWSANPKGTLRIYVDNEEKPAIEGKMQDILGGKWEGVGSPLSGEQGRGWNLYLPIPYAKHCKVTSDADGFYYQVNYRTYEAGTGVESFSTSRLVSEKAEVAKIQQALFMFRQGEKLGWTSRWDATIAPGKSISFDLKPGPAVFDDVSIIPGANTTLDARSLSWMNALRSVIIAFEFDGEQTVWCPLGEFFCGGLGVVTHSDWYRFVAGGNVLESKWRMPYSTSGRLTLINLGKDAVSFGIVADQHPWSWDSHSMHFHAGWRQQSPLHTRPMQDWNYVEITGKGVYVGDNMAITNPNKDWWGEGDEKIYVDGEKFPSHFGTGTEDYYSYAWSSPQVFQHPFHGQPDCDTHAHDSNYGRSVVTRVRSLDGIPFTKSFKFDMEIWHWKECDEALAVTTYWYALPGSTSNRGPSPEEAAKPVPQPPPLPPPFKVANAVECESLKPTAKTEGIEVGPQGGFGPSLWSGDAQLWIQAKKVGDFVELKVPSPVKEGSVKVTLYATKSWDYGIIRFSLNGKPAGADSDLYSGKHEVLATGPIALGETQAHDGVIVLRAEVVGGNPKSEGSRSFFGLDCVVVQPK